MKSTFSSVVYHHPGPLPEIRVRAQYCLAKAVVRGETRIMSMTATAARAGHWDAVLKRAATVAGIHLQYDELAAMREELARQIVRYDPTRAKAWRYMSRSAFWALRVVRGHWSTSQVYQPSWIVAEKRPSKGRSIDAAREAVAGAGEPTGSDLALLHAVESHYTHREQDAPEQRIMRDYIRRELDQAVGYLSDYERRLFRRRAQFDLGLDRNNRPAPNQEWRQISKREFKQTPQGTMDRLLRIKAKLRKRLANTWREYQLA